jgi:hypothetical protein
MKKLLYLSATLFCILTIFQSCSKESANEMIASTPPVNIVNATVSLNKTYQLTFNSGEVNISKQASHFTISQVERGSENASIIYKYVPAPDFVGVDEVVLSIKKAITNRSGGCNDNRNSNNDNMSYSTSYTTVKLNVTK